MAAFTGTGAAQALVQPNSMRAGLSVFNNSGVAVYIKFGDAASSTDFTVKMADQAFYEAPLPVYTGLVTGFWASGNLLVTEVTTNGDEVLP